MSRGHGKWERLILEATEEKWAGLLIDLLKTGSTRTQRIALERAAHNLEAAGKIELGRDRGKLVILKAPLREYDGELVGPLGAAAWSKMQAPLPKGRRPPKRRFVVKVGDGKFSVFEGYKINSKPLSRAEAGVDSEGRAPSWNKREAELDKMSSSSGLTRAWRPGKDETLREKAVRIIDDRKDYLETQERLERDQALKEAVDDDRRRGQKWRKGLGPRGDEDDADDERPEPLPVDNRQRAVDAVDAIDGEESANRLLSEAAGTLEQVEQDQVEHQAQAEQEQAEVLTEDQFRDEETLRYSEHFNPPTDDDSGDADDLDDDGD
jgi:hypothetical protein